MPLLLYICHSNYVLGMGTNTKPLRLGYEQISPGDTAQRVTQRFDRVVWMGDFNYRINGQRASVASLIGLDKSAHNLLLANDQLKIEMLANRVFHGRVFHTTNVVHFAN